MKMKQTRKGTTENTILTVIALLAIISLLIALAAPKTKEERKDQERKDQEISQKINRKDYNIEKVTPNILWVTANQYDDTAPILAKAIEEIKNKYIIKDINGVCSSSAANGITTDLFLIVAPKSSP